MKKSTIEDYAEYIIKKAENIKSNLDVPTENIFFGDNEYHLTGLLFEFLQELDKDSTIEEKYRSADDIIKIYDDKYDKIRNKINEHFGRVAIKNSSFTKTMLYFITVYNINEDSGEYVKEVMNLSDEEAKMTLAIYFTIMDDIIEKAFTLKNGGYTKKK